MPIDLSTNQIIEKNKISSDNIELLLLEITYPSEDSVRVCLNNAEVTWPTTGGDIYYPALFSLTGMKETKDAEIPSVSLSFIDITRALTPHIEEYNGGIGAIITIRVVDSKYLDVTTPKLEEVMEIIDCNIDHSNKITFKLGAENLSTRRCPQERFLKNHCRFKEFGGSRCGYTITGGETCDRTFTDCETLGNESRFGGFPGVGSIGFLT